MTAIPLLFLGWALLLGSGPDRVVLVKGDKALEGRVVFEGADEIVLRDGPRDQRIARKDIAEIRSLERSLAPILGRDLRAADVPALVALAEECKAAGLEHEAKNLWLRALLADPKNDAAYQGLGASRVRDDVRVVLGKDKLALDDLRKRQASWREAFELPTTHFLLRTDLDLPFALDVALGLERFHQRFYETLGSPLELYVFDQSPEVDIYGHEKDFPAGPVRSDTIWFAPGANALHVLASADPSVAALVHELSKQMVFNALRRSAGATAQVPPWTSIGIAELFAKAAPRERFGAWSDLGIPDKEAFGLASRVPLDLEQVFHATINDFNASREREERTANAYTFVHYLVFARNGELRPKYGLFLREGAKGRISLQALADALGMKREEILKGWRAHVAEQVR